MSIFRNEIGGLYVVGIIMIGIIFFFMFDWYVWYDREFLLMFFVLNNVCIKISWKVVCGFVDKIRMLLVIVLFFNRDGI